MDSVVSLPKINKTDLTYVDGEKILIAYLLQDVEVDAITNRCHDRFFSDTALKFVYKACFNYSTGIGKGSIHHTSVISKVSDELNCGEEYISFLRDLSLIDLDSYPSIDFIIETLSKLSLRRDLVAGLEESLTKAKDETQDIDLVLADTEDKISSVYRIDKGKSEQVFPDDLVVRRITGLKQRWETKPVYTYWDKFDAFLSTGFAPGKMSIIAGRTSMGKSFFKTNAIINMCQNGIGVLNICPEQGFDSEHDRIDAIMTGIHLKVFSRIRDLPKNHTYLHQIKNNTQIISEKWNYSCVPYRGITVAGVRSAIRRMKRKGIPCNVVFIDLFDRLDDVNVARDRTANIAVKLAQIEKIEQEEQVHICLLVQINRGTESRKDHRPTMSDLRDCGHFEQDADLILLLYREGYYNKELDDNILDVIIAKQRDGIDGITFEFFISDKQTLSIVPMGEKQKIEE